MRDCLNYMCVLTARNEPFGHHIKNKLKSINFYFVMTLTVGKKVKI